MHGEVDIYRGVATLRIKALCQVLSNCKICLGDWNIEANNYSIVYQRNCLKKLLVVY